MESERENSCEDWEPKEKFINWWHDGGLDKRDGGADQLEWLEEKKILRPPGKHQSSSQLFWRVMRTYRECGGKRRGTVQHKPCV